MKLSIMLTIYNCIDNIDSAIDSIVNQNIPYNWELLIGDDGSTDGTAEKAKAWEKKYPDNIKVYVMKRTDNEGKTGTRAARNRANLLENAKGDYLAFLDGDDILLGEEKFVKQLAILEKHENARFSCVAHNILANEMNNNKQYLMVKDNVKEGEIDTRKYWKSMYFHTNTILFRAKCKEMMLKIEYRDYLNDNFITYIILQYGQIFYINETYAQYNITGEGLWTGNQREYGCFRNIILYDLERRINPELHYESYVRHLYDILYISRNYDEQSDTNVQRLLECLDKTSFPVTFLLAKTSDSSIIHRLRRSCLTFFAEMFNVILHIVHIKEYIQRKVDKTI